MKQIIVAILIILLLISCVLVKPKPPTDLVAFVQQSINENDSFKIVDSYKFPLLNDADISNNTTEKWCIAYTWATPGPNGFNQLVGVATVLVKIGENWELVDLMSFGMYEQYAAEKTSCQIYQERYSQ